MPRTRTLSLETLLQHAIAPVVQQVAGEIERAIASMVAEQLEAELRVGPKPSRRRPRALKPSSRPRVEIAKWVADRRARRVPTFVIEATGLDTKKKIVAKYGEGTTFEKDKPLPPRSGEVKVSGRRHVTAPATEAAREVKARPPIVRRKSAAI